MMGICSRLRALTLAAIAIGILLWSACSSTSGSPPAPETSTTTTQPYGSLVVATELAIANMDPQPMGDAQYQRAGSAIFDDLMYFDPNGQMLPGIAERYEIGPDGLTHTFYIRKGVKFHDGNDLTGADVKFSLERMMAPQSFASQASAWRGAVASVELKDDFTVVLHMKQPRFDPFDRLGWVSGMTAVMPKNYIEEKGVDYFKQHPVGSGPWKFVKLEPGSRLELEATESHWRASLKFKNITILNVSEESTKVAMLKTGELDLATVAPDSAAGLQSSGLRVVSFDAGALYFGLPFFDPQHPDKYVLGDVRVRKAMQLAINAKEIADNVLAGRGAPAPMAYVNAKAYFYDPNVLKPDPYDPEVAKKLLAEAGYSSTFKAKLWETGGGGLISTINQAVAGYWRKIGANVDLVPIEYAVVRSRFTPKPVPDLWDTAVTILTPGPNQNFEGMLRYHSTKGIPQNHTNRRLDELIDKVPTIKDPVEKKRAALEAASIAKNEYLIFHYAVPLTTVALGAKVGDFPAGLGESYVIALW